MAHGASPGASLAMSPYSRSLAPLPLLLPLLLQLLLQLLPACDACSSWSMENGYTLSGRTLDQSSEDWLVRQGMAVAVVPRGTRGALGRQARYGHVGFLPLPNASSSAPPRAADEFHVRMAGLNERGLSCDEQHLDETHYQEPSGNQSSDLPTGRICEWAVMNFASVDEVLDGLRDVRLVQGTTPDGPDGGHHYTFRDGSGVALLVEVLDGIVHTHLDGNDGGKTGFGVVTNSPPFPFQLEAMRFMRAKQAYARPAVAMPGSWYSDERFQRIYLIKSGMAAPRSLPAAVAQAFTVMDAVTVPRGALPGTDSDRGDGEAGEDFTVFGAVYDHHDATVYWRTAANHAIQRLRLRDLEFGQGASRSYVAVDEPTLPWFHDAMAMLHPIGNGKEEETQSLETLV